MRLAPTSAIADLIEARAKANTDLPVRELMWGMPGSMLACIHMDGMTGEPRWRALFEVQAAHWIGPAFAAPQEYGRQADRDGDNRSPGILFVTVLMEAEFSACDVAVDQASVRIVVGEAGLGGGAYG